MPANHDRRDYTDRELLIALGGELEDLTEAVKNLKTAMEKNSEELIGKDGLRVQVGILSERVDTLWKIVWGTMAAVAVEAMGLVIQWVMHLTK